MEVVLLNDPIRTFSEYQSLTDANGRFFIRNNEGTDPQVDADYANVEFRLPVESPMRERNLYLVGAFSDWQIREAFKLSYKPTSKSYAARFLLKQGIYNYLYVTAGADGLNADLKMMEGSHFNTENDYTILLYYRANTNDFDELIGYSRLNSIRNQ